MEIIRCHQTFCELEWYEYREEIELPKYLVSIFTKEIEYIKVYRYESYYVNDVFIPHWSYYVFFEWNKEEGFPIIYFNPSTEQEYFDYKKTLIN